MFNRTMGSYTVLWAIAGGCAGAVIWPAEAYGVTVAIVRGWGPLPVFEELHSNWATYGEIPVSIHMSLGGVDNFTYEDLVNTGADVLWLSDSAGSDEQFTEGEIAAVARYTSEGHSILGTYLVFTHLDVDNSGLAPIFGLPETAYAGVEDTDMVFEFACHDLFRSLPDPYVTSGYHAAQVPEDLGAWDSDDLGSTTLLAQTPDGLGVVLLYDAGSYHAIYVSKMVEYYGSSVDAQFLYNALTFSGPTGTAHNLTQGIDYPSIQCALDAAEEGDEIVVDPGTYGENIDFLGKNVTLRSINPLDLDAVELTIIDGGGLDTVVVLSAGEISGFTITGGVNTGTQGGGVNATGTAVVSYNVITGNVADEDGGGVKATDSAVVRNNRITFNEAGDVGGGVNARGDSLVIDNYIAFNAATTGGGGLGALLNSTIRNNTIVFNSSSGDGGGVLAALSAVLLSNIVAFSTDGEGIHVIGSDVTADYNCVFSNFDGNYGGDAVAGANDLNADPQLDVDELHLQSSSPCVDAGDPDLVPLPDETDIDGENRIANGRVDIGCDEVLASTCEGDANGDGTVDPLDSGYVLARFGCPVGTGDPSCDAADQNGDGNVDPLDSGFVLARFGPCE